MLHKSKTGKFRANTHVYVLASGDTRAAAFKRKAARGQKRKAAPAQVKKGKKSRDKQKGSKVTLQDPVALDSKLQMYFAVNILDTSSKKFQIKWVGLGKIGPVWVDKALVKEKSKVAKEKIGKVVQR